jgi:SAM-dependent MidA family methyltransferase
MPCGSAPRSAGWPFVGRTTQAEFLVGNGLEQLLADERGRLPDEWSPWLLLRSAVGRLLDPRALGGYAVVVLGAGLGEPLPELDGLGYRLPARG